MSKIYTPAPVELLAQITRIMGDHHPHLVDAGVTIGCTLVAAPAGKDGEISGPALRCRGWPALAVISITSLRDRAGGMPDARIQLDQSHWETASLDDQDAIIDHELEHLIVLLNTVGKVKYDSAGRPKLKLRPHDYELGGFFSLIQRRGALAAEAKAYIRLHQSMTQQSFHWG